MTLNKLENFIRSTDGRIIFVNPSDINATDAITNDGTSLITPFKTVQRALIESARFSYQKGNNNDLIEKTTILLFQVSMLLTTDLDMQFILMVVMQKFYLEVQLELVF